MTVISQIRRAGGRIRLNDAGALVLQKGAPTEAKQLATTHKGKAIEELRYELANGPSYVGSWVYWRIDDLYRSLIALRGRFASEGAVDGLVAILRDIDASFHEAYDAGTVATVAHRENAQRLIEEIRAELRDAVEGGALASLASSVFPRQEAFLPPRPAPAAKTIDFGAFAHDPQEALAL